MVVLQNGVCSRSVNNFFSKIELSLLSVSLNCKYQEENFFKLPYPWQAFQSIHQFVADYYFAVTLHILKEQYSTGKQNDDCQ